MNMLALCPRIPADVLAQLMGAGHPVSTHQLLHRLRRAGFASAEKAKVPPIIGTRPVILWSLTSQGPQCPAVYPSSAGTSIKRRHARTHVTAGRLVPAYWLLAAYVSERSLQCTTVRMDTSQYTSMRGSDTRGLRQLHRIGLWGSVATINKNGEDPAVSRVVLLPDLGTMPVSRFSRAIRRLIEDLTAAPTRVPTSMLIAVPGQPEGNRRCDAWRELLSRIVDRSADLHVRVLPWSIAARVAPRVARLQVYASSCARPIAADESLSLICRHPALTQRQLAVLLGVNSSRAARLVEGLVSRKLVRRLNLDPNGRTPKSPDTTTQFLEPTPQGRRLALQNLVLPAAAAARYHGVISDRARRPLLRHIAHTLGANWFFVALAHVARNRSRLGNDEALEEWRSAAACARGRFRPDGYGCYRQGLLRCGFFLEYDRGTEHERQYAFKLAAYYRYRDSHAAATEFESFPTVLMVCTKQLAEDRIAWQTHLAAIRHENAPLRILLTTTRHIAEHPSGIHGQIWRAPNSDSDAAATARTHWLPLPASIPNRRRADPGRTRTDDDASIGGNSK